MSEAEGNGKPLLPIPKNVVMESPKNEMTMSSDPANARRHLPGHSGVKYVTGHSDVNHQASNGKHVTGEANTRTIRHPHRIGTWNVRGLNEQGKLQIVEKEMNRKDVHLLGLTETHWRGRGHFTTDLGNTIYFSGPDDESSKGVAFVAPPILQKCVLGYNPINDRIMTMKLNTKPCLLNIVLAYAPTSKSTEEEIELFYEALSSTLAQIPRRQVTMVLGDFNAKVGKTVDDNHLRSIAGKFGIGERNDRGERLIQFCSEQHLTITNTCFKHHIRRLYTWISPGDRTRNQIDYMLINQRWRSSITNVTTYPGADCGSDHQLLVATIKLRLKRIIKPTPNPSCYRVDMEGFRKSFEQKLQDCCEQSVSERWEHLKMTINESASENRLQRIAMKDYITAETATVILERRQTKEGGLSTQKKRDLYAELSSEVQRRCRNDHNAHINNICCELEKHANNHETRDLFRKVKDLTGTRKVKTCVIENEEGHLLTDVEQVLDRWKRYCADLYDANDPLIQHVEWSSEEPSILRAEVENAIDALKRRKTPGKDGISAELLKNIGCKGVTAITGICNAIWKTGKWPEDWTESVFITLHKKGSMKECGNYRTIALISHASKILLHILNKRLHNHLSYQIPEEQAGFVKGKGTREQILNVRQIVEKSREFNSPVIMCFIDYSKAFDCVQWDHLWTILIEMGVPRHLVGLIQQLYATNRCSVKIGEEFSQTFRTKKGVRQGCILSPALFNIYGEYIMRRTLEDWDKGFHVGGKRISNLRYADDTVLLTTSREDMQELFQRLERESEYIGLSVNRAKTKIMVVDRAGILSDMGNIIPGIQTVDHYIYLGSQICSDGSCVPEIKRRIGMARDAMARLKNIWGKRGITIKTKMRLIRALIFPIFLYGVETWTILARERNRIDAFEMWCWRRMLRIPWTAKRTNESILTQLKVKTRLSTICRQRVLAYFGHVVRKSDENLERLIIVGNTEGKRSRGRSPTRWTDQIKDSSAAKFHKLVQDAMDRNRWKEIIRSKCTSNDDHDPQS